MGSRQAKPTVLVLTPLGKGGMGGIDRLMDEVRTHWAAAAPDLDVKFLTTRGSGSLWLAPFYSAAAAIRLIGYRLLRGPCLCHINLASKGSTHRKLALSWLARMLGHGTVIHLHGSRFHDYVHSVSASRRRRIARMYRAAQRIIVLGSFWRDFVIESFDLPPERVLILPNASAARPPRAPEASPPEILFLGEVGERKGVPVLVAALGRLKEAGHDWRAEIAGNGNVAPYRAEIERLGLAARVSFPGWLGEDAVQQRLTRAAVLVLPSQAEGLPMAIVEAFAWGVPVVATPVGSISDVLHDGVEGFVIPVGDDAALARALERLMADAALRRQLGANALAFFQANLAFGPYMEKLAACWRAAIPH